MGAMSEKIDTTGWKPVIIGKGRGTSRQWVLLGYAGRSKGGQMPLALLDGTPAGKASSRRGAWLALSARVGMTGLMRTPTETEVADRLR